VLVGRQLLANRYHNKGTAFTAEERDRYQLNGLLPPVVEDLDTQLQRVREEFDAAHGDIARHIFLRALQATNSVLFYRFLVDNLEELLPIVYTPTVGLACQEWSRTYRREHGLYVAWPDRHRIPELLHNALSPSVGSGHRHRCRRRHRWRAHPRAGDLGVGGMGIPSASWRCTPRSVASIPSERCRCSSMPAPRTRRCSDPLYLGGAIVACATRSTTSWSVRS
jgi:malate dehydrogenase (oxaloacetate-decarboxylating)